MQESQRIKETIEALFKGRCFKGNEYEDHKEYYGLIRDKVIGVEFEAFVKITFYDNDQDETTILVKNLEHDSEEENGFNMYDMQWYLLMILRMHYSFQIDQDPEYWVDLYDANKKTSALLAYSIPEKDD